MAAPRRYLPRALEEVLRLAARRFPAVVLTGPRQAGKTTTLRRQLGPRVSYVSLETAETQALAKADPRRFLSEHPSPVILDEIQFAPELLPYVKEAIDADRARRGRYYITGSQSFALMQGVTESLAGRAAVLHLTPLSMRELREERNRPLPWDTRANPARSNAPRGTGIWTSILKGGYPEPATRGRGFDQGHSLWFSSYLQTYLERDVRSLRQVGDLTQFRAFLQALAARNAQLLNLAELSRSLGLALNTAKAWLSILEASHQVIVLRPYFANLGKRLVKTPKVYLSDTGLLCHLLGYTNEIHLRAGPMRGPVFETAVLLEIYRTLAGRGEEPRIHFWRTSDGHEIDFLVEVAGRLHPVEAKAAETPHPGAASEISLFQKLMSDRAEPGWVVYAGDRHQALPSGATAIPFQQL